MINAGLLGFGDKSRLVKMIPEPTQMIVHLRLIINLLIVFFCLNELFLACGGAVVANLRQR